MHADKLPITGPCPIDLDAIGFDRRARVAHCTHCTKNVHVLSNMTKSEAKDFLRDNKGRKLCVSYSRDEQGRIRFQPDPAPVVPITRLRRGPGRKAGLAATLGMGAALAACTPHVDATAKVDGPAPQDPITQVQPTGSNLSKVLTKILQPQVVPPPPPLAGAAVIPEDLVDGEMEVPDPDEVDLDQPCDKVEPPPPEGIDEPAPPQAKRGMLAL
ncbi:MAG: hypothetical protein K0V04_26000 [Deltaproteobacteria bacterium]|nr:hypothetical protein [Deltaproteobacteria bacterium]